MTHLKSIILFTCACIPMVLQAQVNYVQNPSFEQYRQCPYNIDQIKQAYYWTPIDSVGNPDSEYAGHSLPYCSPEYCNVCDTMNTFVSVPKSGSYNHYPRSGNGMVDETMYYNDGSSTTYRDNLQGRFYTALAAGQTYCVTFYVTLDQLAGYAVNHIGAYIDDGSIDAGQDSIDCAHPQTAYTPQIVETEIIDDTLNWVKIQGSYVANGTERFITIGNFFDDANTNTITISYPTGWATGNPFSYYCVDDVSVIASDAVADAGPDKIIGVGDSVYIGTSDEGMPCTWYVQDSTTPIGYSGGIWVKPAVTTSYVVEMDLCGNVTYDTVNVGVFPAGVGASPSLAKPQQYVLSPNPNNGTFGLRQYMTDESPVIVQVMDAEGRSVYKAEQVFHSNAGTIDAGNVSPGLYLLQLTDSKGRIFIFKFAVE